MKYVLQVMSTAHGDVIITMYYLKINSFDSAEIQRPRTCFTI